MNLLLRNASDNFDWSEISPTIFGAVFESTLNPETRRSGGMHYTSVENIHKVIDPLFLDELKAAFEAAKAAPTAGGARTKALRALKTRLAKLTFLDPACGSGNFLTETYLSLRRLENAILREDRKSEQGVLGFQREELIEVSIGQFYGLEINDFAVSVAKTALWIAESQMMRETEDIVQADFNFLPLKTDAHLVEGNALRMDWNEVIPTERLSYIMGNPPFSGARLMGKDQKEDVNDIFAGWKNAGNLDYVCCWYKKAADYMTGTAVRAALVSTNSVTQGETVANLWHPLFEADVHLDFAHRSFRWDSEASDKAHVHCVIVGFSKADNTKPRLIFDDSGPHKANNINAYLIDAPNVFVENRSKPLCAVPEIGIGNQPIDNGNYLFTAEEKDAFLTLEPTAAQWFRPWYGSQEFISQKPRFCLWLGDCPPQELKKMPHCLKRVEAVRKFRLASKRGSTVKLAATPTRFQTKNMPKGNFIIIPKVSSERRLYVPMGFMTPDNLCSDLVFIISEATLFHFGILTSNVHMAWMRAVCGRLKSDYRYSKDIVYNNFPWPEADEVTRITIEQTSQGILDARARFPEASFADLYDPLTMPPELLKAHRANDRAVMKAYGMPIKETDEAACVAWLMRLYQEKTAALDRSLAKAGKASEI